jgi:hypothetical protein
MTVQGLSVCETVEDTYPMPFSASPLHLCPQGAENEAQTSKFNPGSKLIFKSPC